MERDDRTGRLPDLDDEEEARIQAGIAADPDNPEWTEEDFARARPFAEVFPEMAAAIERSRAELPEGTGRIGMTISVDREVFARLVAGGPDWPDRIDAALRRAVGL